VGRKKNGFVVGWEEKGRKRKGRWVRGIVGNKVFFWG
jgi:hypothetical protein